MQYDQVKNTKDVNFLGQKSLLYSFISFKVGKWNENTGKNEQYKHAKMDNPALRKAMVYGMNVEQVDQRIFHGLRYRINSLIPAQFDAYHDKDIPVYSYNPAKANKLLDQAGYKKDKKTGYRLQPNGKKLTINLAVHVSNTDYRIRKMHEWQRWMYDKAYVVPLSGTYSLVALNSKLTGWSLKPSANVWFEAGFSK